MAERSLAERLKAREEQAMQELLAEYGSLIKSVVYRYLGSLTQCREECINDVLWKIWRNIGQYDPQKSSLQVWIAAICRYQAIDCRRRCAKHLETGSIEEMHEQGIQLSAPEAESFSAETEAILAGLTPEDRDLLIALYAEGEDAEALAQQLGISPSGVYKRAERAKERIRKQCAQKSPSPKKG